MDLELTLPTLKIRYDDPCPDFPARRTEGGVTEEVISHLVIAPSPRCGEFEVAQIVLTDEDTAGELMRTDPGWIIHSPALSCNVGSGIRPRCLARSCLGRGRLEAGRRRARGLRQDFPRRPCRKGA